MSNIFWHVLETEEVLTRLTVDPQKGLNRLEVQRRLTQHGTNELTHETSISPSTLFFNQFKNILSIILILAVILSALVGEIVDAAIILVIGKTRGLHSSHCVEKLSRMKTCGIVLGSGRAK
ncbi:MAG: cation-transporting P-type ATPase [Pseudomonadota bacterium]